MSSPTTLRIWRIQFCLNNLGVWDQRWSATEQEARDDFEHHCSKLGCTPERDDGSWGSIIEPEPVDVEMTAAGLLLFANNYACDQSQ